MFITLELLQSLCDSQVDAGVVPAEGEGKASEDQFP